MSLDGQAAEHEALRCWNGLFDRALQMIQRAREVGLRVHVCCTINRLNWQILEFFTELVYRRGVSQLNYSRFVPTGRGSEALDLSPKEWRAVILLCGKLKELYKGKLEIVSHLVQQILVDAEIKNMPGFIGCQAGMGQGAVSANGYIFPCVLLPIPLGNIREKRFLEIWQTSPVIQALQNRDNLRGHCSECNLRERCGGCRAVAYAKTGDYLESDPRCWLMPDAKAEINSNLETKEAICYV